MVKSKDGFLLGRVKSFKYAFKGAYLLFKTEHSIISQCTIATLFIFIGFICGLTKIEWLFQVLAIGLILSIEGINTAVEKLCDFVHPDYHKQIGFIKDISAGAVTFAAATSVAIILIIYYPYIYAKLF